MKQNNIISSIKTIAESLIAKAGFDKTRTGNIVGRNEITNTYSVKIDGHVYNNVRTVNDFTYNVGDTVKVSIPCNQASQMYIMSSTFSDDSIGKKIVHADSLIDALESQEGSIVEINGHIYQLNLASSYSASSATYTGQVLRDGEDVTSSAYWSNFHWYLLKSSGAEEIETGISNASLTIPLLDYKYGTSLELVWEYNEDISLRQLVVLFDNEEITKVSNKAFDAYGIASNTAQYFWYTEEGDDTGAHITEFPQDTFETTPQGYNLLARSDGVAIRDGENELATFTYNSLNFKVLINNTMVSVAEYGAGGARIGSTLDKNIRINGYDGLRFYHQNYQQGKIAWGEDSFSSYLEMSFLTNDPGASGGGQVKVQPSYFGGVNLYYYDGSNVASGIDIGAWGVAIEGDISHNGEDLVTIVTKTASVSLNGGAAGWATGTFSMPSDYKHVIGVRAVYTNHLDVGTINAWDISNDGASGRTVTYEARIRNLSTNTSTAVVFNVTFELVLSTF